MIDKLLLSKTFVLKISGKLVSPDRIDYIKNLSDTLTRIYNDGYRFAIVVGGGSTARSYISAGRKLGASESLLDILGIESARLNAMLLVAALGENAYQRIPRSLDEFIDAWTSGKIVVCGGLQPGQSTNAVSAIIAETIGARLIINASTIDAVYTGDPKKDPNAKALDKISISQLYELLGEKSQAAGSYELFDHVSLSIMKRSHLASVVVYGGTIDNIVKILKGEKIGTLVYPD